MSGMRYGKSIFNCIIFDLYESNLLFSKYYSLELPINVVDASHITKKETISYNTFKWYSNRSNSL